MLGWSPARTPTEPLSYLRGVARLEFSSAVNVKTTPERAFDSSADHRHVAQVLEGVNRWEPIGPKTKGLGARFNVEMLAFGLPLKNVLRLNRWRRGREIGWASEAGLIEQQGGVTLPQRRGRGPRGPSTPLRPPAPGGRPRGRRAP